MKEITAYQCTKCKTVFTAKSDAKLCEAVHAKTLLIERVEFTKEKPFPSSIGVRIEGSNGDINIIEYYR